MNENKRFSSIARRINRTWARKLIFVFVFFDCMVILLVTAGYLQYRETQALGSASAVVDRTFTIDRSANGVRATVRSVTYRFTDAQGGAYDVPLVEFWESAQPMCTALLWIELVYLIASRLFGGGATRRALKPLGKMARTARLLSEEDGNRTSDKIHSLEDAIEAIAPEADELHTHDPDLAGLEDAVNSLLARMRSANREQARFVSDASHELRTPIAVIQGYAQMLDRWGKTDEAILNESIQAIKSETEHMRELVEQLLFLARGDNGRQKLACATFLLDQVVREVCEESEMIDGTHQWRCLCDGEVPVYADADMIKQVVRILADNAIKYTPARGTITLRAARKDDCACFSVQDEGIGISQADAEHIFERFYRADPARTGSQGGTGLGLSIAKWIVDRHGGYFEVLSKPDLGTRITVYLPERAPEADGGTAS